MAEMHKVKLSPDMVARVTKRRGGKLHAIDRLDPAKTALIVIDMQNVWVKKGMPAYTPYCEAIVPNINRLAAAMRDAGGSVWWVRAIYGDDAPRTWSAYMEFLSPEFLGDMLGALTEGADGAALWHELDIQPGDRTGHQAALQRADPRLKRSGRAAAGGGHRHGDHHRHGHQRLLRVDGARCIHAELPDVSRLGCQRHSVGRSAQCLVERTVHPLRRRVHHR